MSGEVVNLRQARKARARDMATAQAAGNRLKFGRTKAEKTRDAAELARHEQAVAGARLQRE